MASSKRHAGPCAVGFVAVLVVGQVLAGDAGADPESVRLDAGKTVVAASGAIIIGKFKDIMGLTQKGKARVFIIPTRAGPCYRGEAEPVSNKVSIRVDQRIVPNTYIIQLVVPYVDASGRERLINSDRLEITVREQQVTGVSHVPEK
jgi:hypothetical protein